MKPTMPRRAAALLAVLLSAWLTACGPGVGGTGTGEGQRALQLYGAEAAPLCASELEPLLSCAVQGSPTNPAPAPAAGSAVTTWADTGDGRQLQATLSGNEITLNRACPGLQFRGVWGAVPGQTARFYGFVAPDSDAQPASLLVQREGAVVWLTLVRADGAVPLGPAAMAPASPLPVPAAPC